MTSVKKRVHEILESTRPNDGISRAVQAFIITLIVLNVATVVLATVEAYQQRYGSLFHVFELVSVAIFTLEYVLRVWSCTASAAYQRPFIGRLRYMVTPGAIIDLLAILPFFLRFLPSGIDLRAIRVLRLFRLLRLLKIGHFSRSADIFADVLREKKSEIFITLLTVGIALVFASSLMYYAERTAQPDAFSSIPAAMWWGIVTLTTVGYGGVVPETNLGRALGGLIALVGIGLFALPAGILASGLEEALERRRELESGGESDEEEGETTDPEGDTAEDTASPSGNGSSRGSPSRGGSSRNASPDGEHAFCPCCGQRLPEAAPE